jgi:hypothetical protein
METSLEKNHGLKKDVVRFALKVTTKLEFEFKIFSITNSQHKLFYANFWHFLKPFVLLCKIWI